MTSTNTPPPATLTDIVRRYTNGLMLPVAHSLYRYGVHPDAITLLGLLMVVVAAVAIVQGTLWLGGLILVLGMPLDALDGMVARLRDDVADRPFGGFLDSTLDRYADGLIFGALAFYGKQTGSDTVLLLALVALTGAYMVSYTRARAEGQGLECKVGLFSRMERSAVLLVLLFTGWVAPLLWVLALGTQFTALQRIWHVRHITRPAQTGVPTPAAKS